MDGRKIMLEKVESKRATSHLELVVKVMGKNWQDLSIGKLTALVKKRRKEGEQRCLMQQTVEGKRRIKPLGRKLKRGQQTRRGKIIKI